MTLNEVYQACICMQVGQELTFQLDVAPARGIISDLTARINRAKRGKDGTAVSLLRNGTVLTANCYVPKR